MKKLPISKNLNLYAHIPKTVGSDTPILVSVHGISRNAKEHCRTFAAAVGEHAVILAPLFRASAFPSYQRLGIGRSEPRADVALDAALSRASTVFGINTARAHFFGFSGGAQFCQRYAMLNPGAVATLHLASAGWYTWFDTEAPWPRGCDKAPEARKILDAEPLFHRIPCHIYVGEEDILRDASLRMGGRIDAQQGKTRFERAHRWVAHLRTRRTALAAPVTLSELPRTGHDFTDACNPERGDLASLIAGVLIDDSRRKAA